MFTEKSLSAAVCDLHGNAMMTYLGRWTLAKTWVTRWRHPRCFFSHDEVYLNHGFRDAPSAHNKDVANGSNRISNSDKGMRSSDVRRRVKSFQWSEDFLRSGQAGAFPTFYRNRRFRTMSARARHWTLSRAITASVHKVTRCLILILFYHRSLILPRYIESQSSVKQQVK